MWDTSNLSSERRAYLDSGFSFEVIAQSMASEARVLRIWLEPYYTADPMKEAERSARQVCFRVAVSPRTFDLFYNSADGLRGRYWQGPKSGFESTKHLISLLRADLMRFAEANSPRFKTRSRYAKVMSLSDVGVSLDALSAKVWVGEEALVSDQPELIVQRWIENETKREIDGVEGRGRQWRSSPANGEIEVKGALIDSNGVEHTPISKVRRSEQIHYFGFT